MRKVSFFIILFILFHICSASGEQLSVSWEIGTGDNKESGTAQILLSDESIILTSSWLNDYALVAGSKMMMTEKNKPLFCIQPVLQYKKTDRNKLSEILTTWADGLPSDLSYGNFVGDSFESASVELTRQITWYDLSVLLNKIKESMPEPDSGNAFGIVDSRIREMAIHKPARFLLKNYDNGDAYSLSVIRGEETVATCSADLNADKISIVIGWAENRKDYYFAAQVFPGHEATEWHADYLADDSGAGYRGIPADGLILSMDGNIRITEEAVTVATEFLPVNGTGPIRALLTFGKMEAGLELFYGDDKDPLMNIQGKTEQENREELLAGKTVLVQGQMTPEEKNTLSGILVGHSIGLLYKLNSILPQELITILLPGT